MSLGFRNNICKSVDLSGDGGSMTVLCKNWGGAAEKVHVQRTERGPGLLTRKNQYQLLLQGCDEKHR